MKKLIVLFLPIFLFFACDEIPPDLGTGSGGDPITGEVVQKVLMEEFTGVRCVNCPAGSKIIESLLDIHGDRLFAVSIHATEDFATPLNESEFDFRVNDGASLFSFLGETGFPTGVVNRSLFESEDDLQLGTNSWAGYIDQALAVEPTVGIELTGSIDDGVLKANVQVQFLVDVGPEEPKITLMITESNIVDAQIAPDGLIEDYIHNHVLRDVITPFDGESIDGSSSEVIELDYTYNIPSEWNNSELTIIAVVHNSATNKEVLQVEGLEF